MTHPADTLDTIRKVEREKQSVLIRLLLPVTIASTAEYSGGKPIASGVPQVSFKAAVFYPVLLLSFFLLPIFVSYLLAFHTDRGFQEHMLLSLALAILVFCLVAYTFFFRKSFVYRLCVGTSGIKLDKKHYDWGEIAETAIIEKGSGRNYRTYLGILLRDGTYRRVDISLFWNRGFRKKLSGLIEYYKGCYQQSIQITRL